MTTPVNARGFLSARQGVIGGVAPAVGPPPCEGLPHSAVGKAYRYTAWSASPRRSVGASRKRNQSARRGAALVSGIMRIASGSYRIDPETHNPTLAAETDDLPTFDKLVEDFRFDVVIITLVPQYLDHYLLPITAKALAGLGINAQSSGKDADLFNTYRDSTSTCKRSATKIISDLSRLSWRGNVKAEL